MCAAETGQQKGAPSVQFSRVAGVTRRLAEAGEARVTLCALRPLTSAPAPLVPSLCPPQGPSPQAPPPPHEAPPRPQAPPSTASSPGLTRPSGPAPRSLQTRPPASGPAAGR